MKYLLVCIVSAWLALGSAHAAELTDADYAYLASIGQGRADTDSFYMIPAQKTGLHNVINDLTTANDPKARGAAVDKYLDDVVAQSIWCTRPDQAASRRDQSASRA
jgi:hypothetical protein